MNAIFIEFELTTENYGCLAYGLTPDKQGNLLRSFRKSGADKAIGIPTKDDGKDILAQKFMNHYKKYVLVKDENGNERGEYLFYPVINTKNSIKHALLGAQPESYLRSPRAPRDEYIRYVLSPRYLLGGDLVTSPNAESTSRSEAIEIKDMVDYSQPNPTTMIPISNSSEKGINDDKRLSYVETIGKTTTKSIIRINLKQLQFLCADKNSEENISDEILRSDTFKEVFKDMYGIDPSPYIGAYVNKFDMEQHRATWRNRPLNGMVLPKELLIDMVRYSAEMLFKFHDRKSRGESTMLSLRYRLIRHVKDDAPWVEINSMDDVSNIDFDYEECYKQVDDEYISSYNRDFGEVIDEVKGNAKKRKDEKNESKNKSKAKQKDDEISVLSSEVVSTSEA